MKINSILFAAATMYFFTACNNGSETTTTNTDSMSANMDTSAAHKSTMPDTAMSGSGLMKASDDMMAKMHAVQMSGDFDVDFANMMVEHHQGGIDMAKVEVAQGTDEKIKSMAQKIITKQTDEQQMLRDFVKNYKPSGMKHGEGDMQKSMDDMMNKMKNMQMSGNVDKDFATMMISHHEDGMAMQKMEVKNGMSDKLKQMAQKGITEHQKEISEFKEWLASHK
ncbi:MAG: DUF305 domain-containing protein [Segetibacter sp.]